jgi:hypothetical protein
MEPKTLEELANDPVMGRAIREIADYFKAAEVKLAAERPGADNGNSGNNGSGGMPTDNARGRDITQDRPTPHLPTYTLASPTPVEASQQAAIKAAGGADLSWHKELVKAASALSGPDQGLAKDRGAEQVQGRDNAPVHQHTRDPQGRGR